MGRAAQEDARDGIRRTVTAVPGRLRSGSAVSVLALLGASAIAPVSVAVLGGGAVATALAGIVGNMGSGYLAAVVERAANRIRGTNRVTVDDFRDILATEFDEAFDRQDSTASQLKGELMTFLQQCGGLETAIENARDDLHAHLSACFRELADRNNDLHAEILTALSRLKAQGSHQMRLLGDLNDREWYNRRRSAEQVTPPAFPPPDQLIGTPTVTGSSPNWQGGAEVEVGERVYLVHEDSVTENITADHSSRYRQARASQIVPKPKASGRYVWLRQAVAYHDSSPARAELRAVAREHALITELARERTFPGAGYLETTATTSTLVSRWPASRATGAPCDSLDTGPGGDTAPIDPWRLHRLLTGLAGLCDVLAALHKHRVAHRYLAPAGLIVLDTGKLVLRDLGLAGRDARPGEGPVDSQAPEQRRRGWAQVGSHTDVYQLAAVAYHLIAGTPPDVWTPVPVGVLVPGVPEQLTRALNVALAPEPADRPGMRTLSAALRDARDHLSPGSVDGHPPSPLAGTDLSGTRHQSAGSADQAST